MVEILVNLTEKKIPVTKSNLLTLADPTHKEWKKTYKRKIFKDNPEAYKYFVQMYKEAQADNSKAPFHIAWINFRLQWEEAEEGGWVRIGKT